MKTITEILIKGLAKTGNGFRITLNDLTKNSGLTENEVIIALNTISWNAWNLIIE